MRAPTYQETVLSGKYIASLFSTYKSHLEMRPEKENFIMLSEVTVKLAILYSVRILTRKFILNSILFFANG